MPNTTTIKVRGYHLDFYGHVNNARYLEFLEEARWCLLDDNVDLESWRRQGLAFAVANIDINYRRPALQGDLLEIRSTLKHVGGKCAVIHQEVVRRNSDVADAVEPGVREPTDAVPVGGTVLIADADISFVVIDLGSGRAVPLDGEVGDVIRSMGVGA